MADPVTLSTLALGTAVGGLGSLFGAKAGADAPSSTAVPATPPPMAPPPSSPTGQRNGGAQPQGQPSFIGSTSAVPQQTGYGQKTLTGQ